MQVDFQLKLYRALYRLFTPRRVREERQREIDKQRVRKEWHHQEKMKALQAALDASDYGGNYLTWIRAHHNHALQVCRLNGTGFVQIDAWGAGGRFCEACAALDGKTFRIEDELARPHLPAAGCTCTGMEGDQTGFCLCTYNSAFEDEFNQQK